MAGIDFGQCRFPPHTSWPLRGQRYVNGIVQGWAADDLTNGEIYEPVTCTACGRVHLVNPKSGKVLETAKASTAS